MKTFLRDLKNELIKQNMNDDDIEDILRDHEEMIEEALRQGLKEEDIYLRFGEPKALARELAENSTKNVEDKDNEEDQEDVDGYVHWKSITPIDSMINVSVSLVYEDIVYQVSKDSNIHVYYDGTNNIKDYNFSYQNGEIKLEAPKMKNFVFMRSKNEDMNFILEIPKGLKVETLRHNSTSADIEIVGINANELSLSTTSGDLDLSKANFDVLKVNTVSGDLEISNVGANQVETSQVSGDLEMNQVTVLGLLHAGTVSGDISLTDTKAVDAEFSCVSGDVEGVNFYPESINFKSVSGDLSIKNSERKEIKLKKTSTLSGEINIE